jgi:2-keto-4-pentenoate hydratase/2-oxohepta-3-ene-1,7-dioic acid hydratase in catechol pathway
LAGSAAKTSARADALDYVLGYTCANDVSARDWQRDGGGGQWCTGQRASTPSAPLGPVLVTARRDSKSERPPHQAPILNSETMQDWNTERHDLRRARDYRVSQQPASTLLPGTVILTGTPHGVGFARNPPVWLKAGDTVSIDIEKIGTLTNPVINEPV